MAITKNITWRTLSVTGAVLRINAVRVVNNPTMKSVEIRYAVYASSTAYGNGEAPIYLDNLELNSVDNSTEFAAFKSKMEEVDENVISASYVAVKQLATWTSATDTDLGDE